MPKKIKSVKKSRSSKPKLVGTISKEELKDIIITEKWNILQPKLDLIFAEQKIEELQDQIDNPDYHSKSAWRGRQTPNFLVDLDKAQVEAENSDKLIHELDSISAFFCGIVIAVSGIATLTLALLLMGL